MALAHLSSKGLAPRVLGGGFSLFADCREPGNLMVVLVNRFVDDSKHSLVS